MEAPRQRQRQRQLAFIDLFQNLLNYVLDLFQNLLNIVLIFAELSVSS